MAGLFKAWRLLRRRACRLVSGVSGGASVCPALPPSTTNRGPRVQGLSTGRRCDGRRRRSAENAEPTDHRDARRHNANGDIFGGWLTAQMDLGASVLVRTRARGRVATVAVDGMAFHKPALVGDVVSIHAEMLREGKTSMTIGIEARVMRQPSGVHQRVTEATFVFVAVDQSGSKRLLPTPGE